MQRFFFLLTMLCLSASATTYYVDGDNGNDGNAGTSEGAAFATIGAATSAATPTVIYVQNNGSTVYTEQVDLSDLQVDLIGYGSTVGDGTKAVIDGEDTRATCITATNTAGKTYPLIQDFDLLQATGSGFYSGTDLNPTLVNVSSHDNGSRGFECGDGNQVVTLHGCAAYYNVGSGAGVLAMVAVDCVFAENGDVGLKSIRDVQCIRCVFVRNVNGGVQIPAGYVKALVDCVADSNTVGANYIIGGSGAVAAVRCVSTNAATYDYDVSAGDDSAVLIDCYYGSGGLAAGTGSTLGTARTINFQALSTSPWTDPYANPGNTDPTTYDYTLTTDSDLFDVSAPVGGDDNVMAAYTSIGPKVATPAAAVYITDPQFLNFEPLEVATADQPVFLYLYDSGDGVTPETGIAFGDTTVTLSINGGSFSSLNNYISASWMEYSDDGKYSVRLDATDTVSEGYGVLRVAATGCKTTDAYFDIGGGGLSSAEAQAAAEAALTAFGASTFDAASDTVNVGLAEGTDFSDYMDALFPTGFSTLTISGGYLYTDAVLVNHKTPQDVDDMVTAMEAAGTKITLMWDDIQDGGRADLLWDAINSKTTNLPADPADDSDLDAALATVTAYVDDLETRLTALRASYMDELSGGVSTFDPSTQTVTTDAASRTASQADLTGIPTASENAAAVLSGVVDGSITLAEGIKRMTAVLVNTSQDVTDGATVMVQYYNAAGDEVVVTHTITEKGEARSAAF